MMKNRVRFYIVLAVVLAIFSAIAFIAPFSHSTVFWLSYVFGVIAIAVQAYSWPKAFSGEGARSKVYGFPIARVTTIYMVVQLILSLIFMIAGAKVPAWIPVILYIVLLGLAAIGLIAVEVTRDEVERQETVKEVNTKTMKALQAKASAIAASCSDVEKKKVLNHMAEAFRYSDPVSSDATQKLEMKLEVMLDELQESGNADLVNRIESVLSERNQLCKMSK